MTYSKEYWQERLPSDLPEHVRRAIVRVYSSYPAECMPQGLSDPMYMINVIAYELGVGDGQGNFNPKQQIQG